MVDEENPVTQEELSQPIADNTDEGVVTDGVVDKGAPQKTTAKQMELGQIENDEDLDPMQAAFDPRLIDMVTPAGARDLEAVYNVPVTVTAVLGKSRIQVSDLLKMKRGVVMELDRKIGEPIDIFVNGRLVARGEVVVVKERLGITMTEIIKSEAF